MSDDNFRTLKPGKSGKLEKAMDDPVKKKSKFIPKKLGENPWGINPGPKHIMDLPTNHKKK